MIDCLRCVYVFFFLVPTCGQSRRLAVIWAVWLLSSSNGTKLEINKEVIKQESKKILAGFVSYSAFSLLFLTHCAHHPGAIFLLHPVTIASKHFLGPLFFNYWSIFFVSALFTYGLFSKDDKIGLLLLGKSCQNFAHLTKKKEIIFVVASTYWRVRERGPEQFVLWPVNWV